jgi:hypothetical protein
VRIGVLLSILGSALLHVIALSMDRCLHSHVILGIMSKHNNVQRKNRESLSLPSDTFFGGSGNVLLFLRARNLGRQA